MRLPILLIILAFFLNGCTAATGTKSSEIEKSPANTLTEQLAYINKTAGNYKSASCAQIDQAMANCYSIGYILKSDNKDQKNSESIKKMDSYFSFFQKEYKGRCGTKAPLTQYMKTSAPKIIKEGQNKETTK